MTDWWDAERPQPRISQAARPGRTECARRWICLCPAASAPAEESRTALCLNPWGDDGGITLGELQRSAENVLRCALNTTAYARFREYRG